MCPSIRFSPGAGTLSCVVVVSVRVVVVVAVDVAVCVCVSSCLALKNAPVCTFKTLPCVLSKRPCHIGHGRFEGSRSLSLPLFSCLSPLMCLFFLSLSLSLCSSLFLSLLTQ